MKVLVIPEDPTLDQHVLKPVVERLFKDFGPGARITILQDPHLEGLSQALDPTTIGLILERYPMADLFLLIVDRDCDQQRHQRAEARELQARDSGRTLFGCLAIEEVETWALALHASELADRWKEVRAECHPKEVYFEPLAREKGWLREGAGRGRSAAMRALPGNWKALRSRCPELQGLQDRIQQWLGSS